MTSTTQHVSQIRCAHCKGYHASINEVRVCSLGGHSAPMVTTNSTDDFEVEVEQPLIPVQAPLVDAEDTIPAGRYAIDFEGKLRFFKVDRPTEGRWTGYVFVKEQASDDLWPVKGPRRGRVLAAIAEAGPDAASTRYGRELGHCGVCGRTLTDESSRAAGIGPKCAEKMGWAGAF